MKKNYHYYKGETVAIGVSGGPDSMALAMLINKWAQKNQVNIVTFTVDHGLRPKSKSEANFVKKAMKKVNIPHETLTWKGIKPETGIQNNARIARYRLLAEACIKHKANYILLGHHKDDQIETFIMRLSSNSGLDGLSCMSKKNYLLTEFGPIKIMRPLLEMNKKDLIDFCIRQKIKWINDPSNEDNRYMRTKIRSISNNQLTSDFYKTILIYKKLKQLFDAYVEDFIEHSFLYNQDGICQFSRESFLNFPYLFQERILKKIFCSIGGKTYPPKSKTIKRIINNICSENFKNATAGKVFFDINKNVITTLRQPENFTELVPLVKKIFLWDKRFMVLNKLNKPNLSIGHLGEKDYMKMIKLKKIKKLDIHRYAGKTFPAIRSLDEIVYIPHLRYSKSKYWERHIEIKYLYDKKLHFRHIR